MTVATNPISNTEDIIDSRDIIARIEYLASISEDCGHDPLDDGGIHACELWEDHDELAALKALAEEASEYAADWQYGEALIRDSYFQEYAEELAEDCGMIQSDLAGRWPYTCIDWEQAARELQRDYTSVDFDGVTYWIR
jgi:hypothetical protein